MFFFNLAEPVPDVVQPAAVNYAEYPTPRFSGQSQPPQKEIRELAPLAPDSGQRIRLRGGAGEDFLRLFNEVSTNIISIYGVVIRFLKVYTLVIKIPPPSKNSDRN